MKKVLESFEKALRLNKKKGSAFIKLLIVIVIIGILGVLAIIIIEYFKYKREKEEIENLNTYALPLVRDCFLELVEYCASNPTTNPAKPTRIPSTAVQTCERLKTSGISTYEGTVKINTYPTTCKTSSPNYDTNINVTLDTAMKYQIVCVPKSTDEGIIVPQCSIQPKP